MSPGKAASLRRTHSQFLRAPLLRRTGLGRVRLGASEHGGAAGTAGIVGDRVGDRVGWGVGLGVTVPRPGHAPLDAR